MRKADLTPEAQMDLEEIWAYIADDNMAAADRFVSQLRSKCDDLANMPRLGRIRPEFGLVVRSFTFRDYLIFYVPTSQGIEVVRILHGARDIESEFGL